uniref:Uncharacterized protein n=1 Tax=Meloidogyne enterolobii TaxID=390850 RepID=A0A6V7WLI6_MELEN|nr:unnamed protein product [Meloidogyne enterolobii]
MFTENKRFTIKTLIFKQPYNNFTSQLQRDAEQFHDRVVQNLTGEALTLFNQIWSIRQDDTITRLAECQQIKNAYR